MNELISVIIPVYNVEKYIEQCIKSVSNQTYKNIEIILINDGSKDTSGEICNEYAKKDDRIKVIHTENFGVSNARNIGIDEAKGDYLTFIDADDYVDEKYVEQLYAQCKNTKSDISITGTIDFKDEDNKIKNKASCCTKTLNKKDAIKEMLNEKYYVGVVWGKMYKKELWNGIRFNLNTKIAEDLEVLYLIFKKCTLVSVDTANHLYYYRIRSGSVVKQKYNKHFENEINIVDKIRQDIEKEFPEIHDYAIKRYITSNFACIMRYYRENKESSGITHLKNNIRKYKLKKYTKVGIIRKIKIAIVLYLL